MIFRAPSTLASVKHLGFGGVVTKKGYYILLNGTGISESGIMSQLYKKTDDLARIKLTFQ